MVNLKEQLKSNYIDYILRGAIFLITMKITYMYFMGIDFETVMSRRLMDFIIIALVLNMVVDTLDRIKERNEKLLMENK